MDFSQGYINRREQQQKLKRLLRLGFVLCGLFLLGIFFVNFKHTINSTSAPLEAEGITPTPTFIPTPTQPPTSNNLAAAIQQSLTGTHGSYGIVVQNVKTGEYYGWQQHQVFKSGSLYKLWVMAVVYQQIQNNKLHLTDQLSKDLGNLAKEFNVTIDPSEPQTTGVLTMTVSDALYQMITISDNNAALLLTDKVKISTLQNFLKKYGFYESKVGIKGQDPTTTASDIALFFTKLYKGQLANTEQTQNMLDLLKEQRLNDKLPLNLPDGIAVAHKTGELDDYSHDAGIVYGPNSDYIIAVLTQSDDTQAAESRIANISQAVYGYFETSSTQ